MLDQDTALALLTVLDEHVARVALMGDRCQLPAIGRGGVLKLACRWSDPATRHTLQLLHRFTDSGYAELTLRMRNGDDPAAVFDDLHAHGLVRLHANERERRDSVAGAVAANRSVALTAATREQVAAINAAARAHLIRLGLVDDTSVAVTHAGERVGRGDRIATRRNDLTIAVANRDIWTVTQVGDDGSLHVTHASAGRRTLPSRYVREHVELAYASTAHGTQGSTTQSAHLVLDEHTTAATAYVAMTRGRHANTVHLVARNLDDARERWVTAFTRDRADLGPAHAVDDARRAAAAYAPARPLPVVLYELRQAWTNEADWRERLEGVEHRHAKLRDIVSVTTERDATVPPLQRAYDHARAAAHDATARVERISATVAANADHIAATLQERLLTITELAEMLGVSVATVRWWLHNKSAPDCYKVGRHVKFRLSDVERWLEARRRPGGSAA